MVLSWDGHDTRKAEAHGPCRVCLTANLEEARKAAFWATVNGMGAGDAEKAREAEKLWKAINKVNEEARKLKEKEERNPGLGVTKRKELLGWLDAVAEAEAEGTGD